MPIIQQMGDQQHMVTIPAPLLRAMGWEKGDELKFSVKDATTLEITEKRG